MATVKDVWNLLDRKAPFRTQMDFDNAGFLVGRGDQQVTRVLVALDITPEVSAPASSVRRTRPCPTSGPPRSSHASWPTTR